MNPAMAPMANYAVSMNPSMAPSPYPPMNMAGPTTPLLFGQAADGIAAPTAPPADQLGPMSGYEGMGTGDGSGKYLPPPPPGLIPSPVEPPPSNSNWTIPSITEAVARDALLEHAQNKCCYGTSPAKEMVIKELQPFNTYRYRLETFTESRACEWVTKPHDGKVVDSQAFGPPPLPWDVPVQVPTLFKDEETKMPVPHTSSLKTCPQCLGMGKTVCEKCHGTGRVQCWVCNGSGRCSGSDECTTCHGNGTTSCNACTNTFQTCKGCTGKGQVLNYIQLGITWKNNVFEFVADHHSEFPTDLFKKVRGDVIFTDENILVPPLVNFPEPSINTASQNALQQHHTQFASSSRILRQKHTIEWLPLTKVEYSWKEKQYSYFVYGKENKVHTKDYPVTCCCCTLL
ncbi:protein SSUH2 homolog [Rhinophrynus dorsalis]